MSGGYRRQGDPNQNRLFRDTGKPPPSLYCDHLLDKPGTLCSLGGV